MVANPEDRFSRDVAQTVTGGVHTVCHVILSRSFVAWLEPPHDKTKRMTMCPEKTQISLGICPVWSESSLCTQLRTQAFFMRTAKTMIRLGRCPGWSESSLGAHAILLVLSWGGSLYVYKTEYFLYFFNLTIHSLLQPLMMNDLMTICCIMMSNNLLNLRFILELFWWH